jgi:hypothetical protein
MNTVVKMILPMVLPKVQKEAATYAANYLNRRHRRRLGLPEPEEPVCPPCPVPADRAARGKAVKNILSVSGSIVAGAALGAGLGVVLAKK